MGSRLWRKTSLEQIKTAMGSTTHLDQFASKLTGRMVAFRTGNPAGRISEEEFGNLALELFASQFETNAPYRAFCNARRVRPRFIKRWEDIPALPTASFKELELSCLGPEDRPVAFYSSGTSQQQPSRHFHNAKSLDVYEASLLAWFRAHFLPETLPALQYCRLQNPEGGAVPRNCAWRFLFLTPPPTEAPHSSLVHMFGAIRRVFGSADSAFLGRTVFDDGWSLDPDRIAEALQKIAAAGKPVAILGAAFSFVHLLDYLGESGLSLQLPRGSRVLETGGYKGRSRALPKTELYDLITCRLGVPPTHLVSEYGMSELSSQAYDSVAGAVSAGERVFSFPPWARALIISPDTGQEVNDGGIGLVRLLDLANVYSALAIQTEDLAIRRGNGFELIGRAARSESRGCSLMAVT